LESYNFHVVYNYGNDDTAVAEALALPAASASPVDVPAAHQPVLAPNSNVDVLTMQNSAGKKKKKKKKNKNKNKNKNTGNERRNETSKSQSGPNTVESTVVGGQQNSGEATVVGGLDGQPNTVESTAVGGIGGQQHTVESTAVGGQQHTVESTAVGGQQNVVGSTAVGGQPQNLGTGKEGKDCLICGEDMRETPSVEHCEKCGGYAHSICATAAVQDFGEHAFHVCVCYGCYAKHPDMDDDDEDAMCLGDGKAKCLVCGKAAGEESPECVRCGGLVHAPCSTKVRQACLALNPGPFGCYDCLKENGHNFVLMAYRHPPEDDDCPISKQLVKVRKLQAEHAEVQKAEGMHVCVC
jgi:hypothetical protein